MLKGEILKIEIHLFTHHLLWGVSGAEEITYWRVRMRCIPVSQHGLAPSRQWCTQSTIYKIHISKAILSAYVGQIPTQEESIDTQEIQNVGIWGRINIFSAI